MVAVRQAVFEDAEALARIDLVTWTSETSPVPAPQVDTYDFFDERTSPADVLVAEVGGTVVGYVKLRSVLHPPSRSHVMEINGLAVDPSHQREGVAPHLVEAAVEESARRGALKVSLRVLGPNARARRLYERCGFVVEGVLRGEFVLDGRPVDDVFMARRLDDGDRDAWGITTHDWSVDVDVEHLAKARQAAESLGDAMALHLVLEVLAYADDEAEGRVVRKPIMATRDVRFFDEEDPVLLPDGLPRRGMSTVSAASPSLLHDNWRTSGAWSQEYRFGTPQAELRELPPTGRTGTTVTVRLPSPVDLDLTQLAVLVRGFAHVDVEVSGGRGADGAPPTPDRR
jgi:ribosomal protein S18 acetylase RimI-like enzyme